MFGKGRADTDVCPRAVRMNGKAFAKLIREAGVSGRGLDATRVDLCFAKCCDKATKRMAFKQFKEALELCAQARQMDIATLTHAVAATQPRVSGTIAAPVKWHDDRSMYTGVHAQGGPKVVDRKIGLEEMVARGGDNLTRKCRRGSIATAWAS